MEWTEAGSRLSDSNKTNSGQSHTHTHTHTHTQTHTHTHKMNGVIQVLLIFL